MAMTAADALERFQRLGSQRWLAAFERRGPRIAVLLLALLIAWQLAGLFWSAWPERPDADISPPVTASSTAGATDRTPSGPDVGPVVDAHLFGIARAEDESATPAPVQENVQEFRGSLQLRGTLASDSASNALAIIADGRDEKIYRIGDRVQNGVTLHSVQREQVLLSRAGVLEALRLPRPEEAQSSAGSSVSRARPSIRRAPTTPTMSQLVTENAAELTQIISPRPYFVGGEQRGYRLYPGTDRQSFAKLGLRAGDIVTAINGTPLNNPSQGARVFSELGSAQSVTVTLERGGQEQTLTLDTSALDFRNQATQ